MKFVFERNELEKISSPNDIKKFDLDKLQYLADDIRKCIIIQVQKNGGHLAPCLGVVELTLALHRIFESPYDKIIWDVGHQSYAHKLLTGRLKKFHTLRQYGGISGFPSRKESFFDTFDTGHSSTSISVSLGIAVSEHLKMKKNKVVAVIGDGSLTGGLAYEGLNQAGDMGRNIVVILNDNGMSIAPNVGAISTFLSRAISGKAYQNFRKDMERFFKSIPGIGHELLNFARRSEESFKTFSTPGMLFEAFKFNYIGPVDGHHLKRLIETFSYVKKLNGPVLVHVLTKKGKGYTPAEKNPSYFHGIGTSVFKKINLKEKKTPFSYTEVFGYSLVKLARYDEKIVAITAAMLEGTGLKLFAKEFPSRFFDVGIAEQHAVAFAAGLAVSGFKPVVAIYSTFLQRAFDQIIHDVCLTNLSVIFALDRAGIVGNDGATHQGLFDYSFLRSIPNMTLLAPSDEDELCQMLYSALYYKGPVAIRYPRGKGIGKKISKKLKKIPWGKAEILRKGGSLVLIGIGSSVIACTVAAHKLSLMGLEVSVVNARFVKPLDEKLICELGKTCCAIITVEENLFAGGFGSAVLEVLVRNNITKVKTACVAIDDVFVRHGSRKQLQREYCLDDEAILRSVFSILN